MSIANFNDSTYGVTGDKNVFEKPTMNTHIRANGGWSSSLHGSAKVEKDTPANVSQWAIGILSSPDGKIAGCYAGDLKLVSSGSAARLTPVYNSSGAFTQLELRSPPSGEPQKFGIVLIAIAAFAVTQQA